MKKESRGFEKKFRNISHRREKRKRRIPHKGHEGTKAQREEKRRRRGLTTEFHGGRRGTEGRKKGSRRREGLDIKARRNKGNRLACVCINPSGKRQQESIK
jgi:hypothetical protein